MNLAPDMTDTELAELGRILTQSLATGDTSKTAELEADRLVTWHNHDRVDHIHEPQAAEGTSQLHAMCRDVSVELRRIQRCDVGVLLEIVLRGTIRTTETPLELYNCMIVTIENGKLTRMDEYVDPNMLIQLSPQRRAGNGS